MACPDMMSERLCVYFVTGRVNDQHYELYCNLMFPNVFQMFQRLCIHVIQRLRPVHAHLYLQPGMEDGYVAPDWSLNSEFSAGL